MAEQNMRQVFVRALKKAGLDPVSVENSAYPGTPDVNCTRGWIELKELPGWPANPLTPVRIPHFTPQQRVWILRRAHFAPDGVWLLIRVRGDRAWLLIEGSEVATVGRCTESELRAIAHIEYGPDEVVKWIDGRYPIIPDPESPREFS